MSEVKNANLILTAAQKKLIETEGVAAYPNECCGIIYGRDVGSERIVEELEPVTNSFDKGEQYHRFSISGNQLMLAEKKCTGGKIVLGFYHSHPDHPAEPSEYDRLHAWAFYSYVIIAIHQKKPQDMTSWTLDEASGEFVAQEISLV